MHMRVLSQKVIAMRSSIYYQRQLQIALWLRAPLSACMPNAKKTDCF